MNVARSCGLLPMAFEILYLCDADNPVRPKRYGKCNDESKDYALRWAEMVGKLRDSTFVMIKVDGVCNVFAKSGTAAMFALLCQISFRNPISC